MYEIGRWIGVAVLGVLWLKFTAYNVFFAADRIHRRSHDGPSPLPIFGSVFGIAALLRFSACKESCSPVTGPHR